jgi:vacuolar iron transporter family protein
MDHETARLMADEDARAGMAAHEFDHDFLRVHLAEERRRAGLLGEIRETVFGAQDGLISTLAVVSAASGATSDQFVILVAGLASALAGVFSMAAGEYMGSKSQREIFDAQIAGERHEVAERPGEAEAEIAYLFEEDGIPHEDARQVARIMARHPEALLKTMVQKELGLHVDEGHGSPFQGAVIMGVAFGLASAVPIVPYLLLDVAPALYVSFVGTAVALFGLGALKSRWTHRNWFVSGAEMLLIGAFAGVAGYLFGSVLPSLLGVNPV